MARHFDNKKQAEGIWDEAYEKRQTGWYAGERRDKEDKKRERQMNFSLRYI